MRPSSRQRVTNPELTCESEEHAGRFEQVLSAFAFTGEGQQQTERTQDGEEQAEDGDGRC